MSRWEKVKDGRQENTLARDDLGQKLQVTPFERKREENDIDPFCNTLADQI